MIEEKMWGNLGIMDTQCQNSKALYVCMCNENVTKCECNKGAARGKLLTTAICKGLRKSKIRSSENCGNNVETRR
jgi:hypothetical protein